MKKYISRLCFAMSLLSVLFFFTSCKSREDKVAETIKSEMFKNLYDFESYQPIETKIDTLRRRNCRNIYPHLLFIKFK